MNQEQQMQERSDKLFKAALLYHLTGEVKFLQTIESEARMLRGMGFIPRYDVKLKVLIVESLLNATKSEGLRNIADNLPSVTELPKVVNMREGSQDEELPTDRSTE